MAEAKEKGASLIPRRAPVLSEFAVRFLQWVESSQLEPKSKRYYRNGWRMIRDTEISGMRLDQITTDEVAAVQFPGSAPNANNALRTLRRMLGKAEEWGLLRTAPRIKLLKEYGRSAVIDPESEARLLAAARQPLRDVLVIMLDTGMRPSEVFRMCWEDVNWETGSIFIPWGKTRNSRRYVPVSKRVMSVLLARAENKRTGWVFPSRSRFGHLVSVEKQFIEARTAAGVSPEVVLYSARHTFATQILSATGNLALLMKAMGHSDAKTAMVYQHPAMEAVRRAVDGRNTFCAERHNSRHTSEMVQ
jgi:integrase